MRSSQYTSHFVEGGGKGEGVPGAKEGGGVLDITFPIVNCPTSLEKSTCPGESIKFTRYTSPLMLY